MPDSPLLIAWYRANNLLAHKDLDLFLQVRHPHRLLLQRLESRYLLRVEIQFVARLRVQITLGFLLPIRVATSTPAKFRHGAFPCDRPEACEHRHS